MLTNISKVFGNNSMFLPQGPFPLRHPEKNHPVTLCQLSSRLCQETLLPPKSIINVGGLAGLQLLSSLRNLLESVTPGLCSRVHPGHHWQACWCPSTCPSLGGGERTDWLFAFWWTLFLKSSPRIPSVRKPVGVSSLLTNEDQCWPCLPLLHFRVPCSARGPSLQSCMCSSNPPHPPTTTRYAHLGTFSFSCVQL